MSNENNITTYQKIHNFVTENEELIQASREFALQTILVDSLLAEKMGKNIEDILVNIKQGLEAGEPLRSATRTATINSLDNRLGKAA